MSLPESIAEVNSLTRSIGGLLDRSGASKAMVAGAPKALRFLILETRHADGFVEMPISRWMEWFRCGRAQAFRLRGELIANGVVEADGKHTTHGRAQGFKLNMLALHHWLVDRCGYRKVSAAFNRKLHRIRAWISGLKWGQTELEPEVIEDPKSGLISGLILDRSLYKDPAGGPARRYVPAETGAIKSLTNKFMGWVRPDIGIPITIDDMDAAFGWSQ